MGNNETMNLVMQKNKELSAILEVSRVLTASFDLEKNLAAVMKILASHLDMQRGCVFLMDSITKKNERGQPVALHRK
jgi:Nif-specific regulatory protein